MKKWHYINVKLNSGIEIQIKVNGMDIEDFYKWIADLPGIEKYEELRSTSPIKGHSNKNTKIANARMAAGYTQQEMADMMGVRIQQYQRWEYGTFVVKTADLMRLGEILDVDWTTLIEEK